MKTTLDYTLTTAQISDSFSKAAEQYHTKATIQKKVANGLISSLIPWKEILPPGPFLEVGCGTGFLSELLIKAFPTRKIILSDISQRMLDVCKRNLDEAGLLSENISFKLLDVNEMEVVPDSCAMVISNFAAQWFKDTAIGLERLSENIVYGGLLLCSFPGNHSFKEWYEYCLELGLPFTANPLPDVEEVVIKLSMAKVQVDYYENDLYQDFKSSLDFFKHLKEIGVHSSKTKKTLSTKQLRLLTNHWDSKVEGAKKVKWHIVYIAAKKE